MLLTLTAPPMPIPTGGLMNNGKADTGVKDVQKLQQQLQDIKDQVIHIDNQDHVMAIEN